MRSKNSPAAVSGGAGREEDVMERFESVAARVWARETEHAQLVEANPFTGQGHARDYRTCGCETARDIRAARNDPRFDGGASFEPHVPEVR